MIEGMQILVESVSGRYRLVEQALWDSKGITDIAVFGYFPSIASNHGYATTTQSRIGFTAVKQEDVSPGDRVNLALRYSARIRAMHSKGRAHSVRCSCGHPFVSIQEMHKAGNFPFRITCSNPTCSLGHITANEETRAELHHWFEFKDLKMEENKKMDAKPETKPAPKTNEAPSFADRLNKAKEHLDVRAVRMVALDDGKIALIDALRSHLDPAYMNPLEMFLKSPGGEACLLGLIGAGAPYATENEFVRRVGDEFLAEGMAKGAHQGMKFLALILKPVYEAIEKKMPLSVVHQMADKISPPKHRVASTAAVPEPLESEESEEVVKGVQAAVGG